MAVQTYSYAQISSGFAGYFDVDNTDVGKRYFTANALWAAVIVGTAASLKVEAFAANPYRVCVDGVSAVPTITTGEIELFSGLSDVPHVVSIIAEPAYVTYSAWWITTESEILTVTGAAPAQTSVETEYGSWDGFTGISTGSEVAPLGLPITPSDEDQIQPATASRGQFVIKSQVDEIWIFTDNNGAWISIDGGAAIFTDFVDYTSQRKLVKIDTAFDNTQEHTYRVWGGDPSTFDIQGILPLYNDAKASLSPVSQLSLFQYGDSITFGEDGATAGEVDCWEVGDTLGLSINKLGVAGQTISGLTAVIPSYFIETIIPNYVLSAPGRNDVGNSAVVIQADYEACIQAFIDAGATNILCRGILPEGAQLWPTQNGAIGAAVDSFSNPNIIFIDTSTWSGIATIDGVHPTAPGYSTIAGYEIPVLQSIIVTSTDFTGGVEQTQEINGSIAIKIILTGGISQTQEISSALTITVLFQGGVLQTQVISGVFSITSIPINKIFIPCNIITKKYIRCDI